MKNVLLLLLFCALIVIEGCSSCEVSTQFNSQEVTSSSYGKPIAHIWAKNYGYYLFNIIPLVSGNPYNPNKMLFFTNNVEPQYSVEILTKKATSLGASKVVNITSTKYESGACTMFIFWYRGAQSSGTAVE